MRGMASIRLELLDESHLEGVAALLADSEVLHFTRVPEPPPPDFHRRWLEAYEARRVDVSGEAFAAVDAEGRFLGLGLVPQIDHDAREVELGYIVAPAARGAGVGTEILRQLTDWAFTVARALRITLIIDLENPASSLIAERCGYVREGVMRSLHLKQDLRIDAALWSRLPSDPEPRQPDPERT